MDIDHVSLIEAGSDPDSSADGFAPFVEPLLESNGITLAQDVDDAEYQALIDSKQTHIRDRCERLHAHVRYLRQLGPVLRGALGKDRLGITPSMQMVLHNVW